MSNVPNELKYSKSHEWIKQNNDHELVIGITDHAQTLLGDLVYVELPEVGQTVEQGDESGVVESVKAASDVYSPVSGEIIAVNEELEQQPELVNSDPFGKGWLFKIKPNNLDELTTLLTAQDYQAHIE